jgi:hypothetical protein
MKEIKTVGIKELKDNLSSYLRDVKSGILVLVTDRGRVVALLKEPDIEHLYSEKNTLLHEWVQEGILIPGNGKKSICPPTGIKLKKGTAQALLDADRGK